MVEKSIFKEIGTKSIVEQIVDSIVNAIIEGELKPGDKIPTETELCNSMNVGRNSVREAIKILVAYGVLIIKRAEGTFVTKGYNSKMLYPVLYGIILQKNAANQVIELRKIIDDGILHLVIQKMKDKSELNSARKVITDLRKDIDENGVDALKIFNADIAFHDALLEITENDLLRGIGSYVNLITKKTRIEAIKKFIANKDVDRFFILHEEVLNILENRLVEKIDDAIKSHYIYWSTVK